MVTVINSVQSHSQSTIGCAFLFFFFFHKIATIRLDYKQKSPFFSNSTLIKNKIDLLFSTVPSL